MTSYKVKAIVDDVHTCDCCGKSNLKRTVAIENEETGEILHFGTTCAVAPEKGFDKDDIKKAVKAYDEFIGMVNSVAHHLYKKAGGQMVKKDQYTWTFADKPLHEQCKAEAREQLKPNKP